MSGVVAEIVGCDPGVLRLALTLGSLNFSIDSLALWSAASVNDVLIFESSTICLDLCFILVGIVEHLTTIWIRSTTLSMMH